jgi:hypothetical protein
MLDSRSIPHTTEGIKGVAKAMDIACLRVAIIGEL